MINKIVAIQGNHPSKLNPVSDTSIFLGKEIQNKDEYISGRKYIFRDFMEGKIEAVSYTHLTLPTICSV